MKFDRPYTHRRKIMERRFSVCRCRSGVALHFAANEHRKAKPDTEAAQLLHRYAVPPFRWKVTHPTTLASARVLEYVSNCDKMESDDWFTLHVCDPTAKRASSPRAIANISALLVSTLRHECATSIYLAKLGPDLVAYHFRNLSFI
jgi:hypothetical protein